MGRSNDEEEVDLEEADEDSTRLIFEVWKKKAIDFEADFGNIETKIHRFPPSLRGLGVRYMVPAAVAIGPYHRPSASRDNLWEMEAVKDLAAYHFVLDSGHSLEKMVQAVFERQAHSVYTGEGSENIDGRQFAFGMSRDGCFLLQYMVMCTARHELAPSLVCALSSNQAVISHDIMLLENQIPWVVIETLRRFRTVAVEDFIAKMGRTLEVRGDSPRRPFVLGDGYRPPHLLGLLHYYKTGTTNTRAAAVSAIELEEMGIKLTASKTTKFRDMGIKKTPFSGEIFLAPLLLDQVRACWLINMAAFEVCIGAGVREDSKQQPVVCSYLAVLAMLMDRKEDVHELRAKRLVQGELTNRETLDFFKTLIKHISGGALYVRILEDIEDYKQKRRMWVKVYAFIYKNLKTIITVLSIIGVITGIFKTLLSLQKH
uniref:Uncharacterized protein n=1 Tax=Setaria viridis TaxID=4556 RepID=A0A4U6U428_SETVI|nr:hypothetical protein SEVIR_6G006500v2 [Setaria viridis]